MEELAQDRYTIWSLLAWGVKCKQARQHVCSSGWSSDEVEQ